MFIILLVLTLHIFETRVKGCQNEKDE